MGIGYWVRFFTDSILKLGTSWPLVALLIFVVARSHLFGLLDSLRSKLDNLKAANPKTGQLDFSPGQAEGNQPASRAQFVAKIDSQTAIHVDDLNQPSNATKLETAVRVYWLGQNTAFSALAALDGNHFEARRELLNAIGHAKSLGYEDSVVFTELQALLAIDLSMQSMVKDYCQKLISLSFQFGHSIMEDGLPKTGDGPS